MTLEKDTNCVESRAKCAQSKDTCVGGSSSSLPTIGHADPMSEPEGVYVDLEHDEDDAQIQEPKSGLTSKVWRTFERIMVNGQQKAKCRYCEKVMSANSRSGTSYLKKLTEKVCSGRHLRLGAGQRRLKIIKEDNGSNTLELKASHEDTFDQEFSRKEFLSTIVMHEYPLSMVDHLELRRFVDSLNPKFKMIYRNTLRCDIIKNVPK